MLSFFNDLDLLESSRSVFNSNNKMSFPTYEQFLPFTDLTVSLANDAIDRDLGRIDMFTACDFLLKRELNPEAMLTALMYIKRFKKRKEVSNQRIASFTSADLFLISMMLASKYLFDDGTEENVVNDEWAEDFGKENGEINALEVDFLTAMDWRLHVEVAEFVKLKRQIGAHLAANCWQSHESNGSTYRELLLVHANIDHGAVALVEIVCKVIAGCVVIYAGIIVGVHLMVFVIHSRPVLSVHQWNGMIDYRFSFPIFSFNSTKDKFSINNDINESQKYHSPVTYSFITRSKILAKQIEQ